MVRPLRNAMMALFTLMLLWSPVTGLVEAAEAPTGAEDVQVLKEEDGFTFSSGRATPAALVAPGESHIEMTIANVGERPLDDITILRENEVTVAEIERISDDTVNPYVFEETIRVSEEQLAANGVTYYITYTCYTESGEALRRQRVVRVSVIQKTAEPKIEFTRTISSDHVKKGDEITVTYRIKNTGNVSLLNIVVADELFGAFDPLEVLEPGKKQTFTRKITFDGTSVSRPSVAYQYEGGEREVKEELKATTIYLANEKLTGQLDADRTAVSPGDVVTLRLKLLNKGNVAYKDLKISDAALGELGVIPVEIKPNDEYLFSKTVTLKSTTKFQFDISGKSVDGNEIEESSNMLTIAVSPAVEDIKVDVVASAEPSRMAQPGTVNFSIHINNLCDLDIRNVSLSEQTRGEIKDLAVLAPGVTTVEHSYQVDSTGTYVFIVELVDNQGGRLMSLSDPVTVELDAAAQIQNTLLSPKPRATEAPSIGGASYRLDQTTTFERMMLSVVLILAALLMIILVTVGRRRRRERRRRLQQIKRIRAQQRKRPLSDEMAQTRPHAPVKKEDLEEQDAGDERRPRRRR